MPLAVSKVLTPEKLLTSYLTVLGVKSGSLVSPRRVDIELFCCCNLFSNKGFEFVFSAGTSCKVMKEEFLMLLMIIFLMALLGLLLTPALTINPDTFWKSTLPYLEAGALSSPPSLS